MTAEIAIMNREAVALAADSAVTVSQGGAPKIFATANKLFALSRHHPVGVMVYGNASFMEVPWETVIKLYRARLGSAAHATIQEYANDFVKFLENEAALAPSESQDKYVSGVLDAFYNRMVQEIQNEVAKKLREETPRTPEEVQQLVLTVASNVVYRYYQQWRAGKYAESMNSSSADALRKQYRSIIQIKKKASFGSDLTSDTSRQLTRLAGWVLTKYDERLPR